MHEGMKEGLAEILGISTAAVQPDVVLNDENWDSMAVISAIALIDQQYNVTLEGRALRECKCIADLLTLVSAARQQPADI